MAETWLLSAWLCRYIVTVHDAFTGQGGEYIVFVRTGMSSTGYILVYTANTHVGIYRYILATQRCNW